MTLRLLPLAALTLLLAACHSTPTDRMTNAAATPLNDLNLVRAAIPAPLQAAQHGPYALPAETGCTAIAVELQALDEVLGSDLDTPPSGANPGLIERGGAYAGDAAVGAIRRTAEGVVPFRSWVRKLSGAERYSKEVAAAIAAGTVRRGYLKGLAAAQGCHPLPDPLLQAAVDGPQRSAAHRARDPWRHPVEMFAFFGVQPAWHVLELAPGAGWATEILAPLLRSQGRLYVAHYPRDAAEEGQRRSRAAFEAKLAAAPAVYDQVVVGSLPGSAFTDLRFERPLDAVVTLRNLHNWLADGSLDERLRLCFQALHPGGVFAVEEHRAAPGTPLDRQVASGYLTEALVIARARAAGFELVGRSELNANPRDPREHPQGVWSLPPTLRDAPPGSPAYERAMAIGESDRMTLRFVRPLSSR